MESETLRMMGHTWRNLRLTAFSSFFDIHGRKVFELCGLTKKLSALEISRMVEATGHIGFAGNGTRCHL